jgi:hypothetical protein
MGHSTVERSIASFSTKYRIVCTVRHRSTSSDINFANVGQDVEQMSNKRVVFARSTFVRHVRHFWISLRTTLTYDRFAFPAFPPTVPVLRPSPVSTGVGVEGR